MLAAALSAFADRSHSLSAGRDSYLIVTTTQKTANQKYLMTHQITL